MTRRHGVSLRDRMLAVSLEEATERELTDTERLLLHAYGKDNGVNLFPEFDAPKRRRRRENR